MQLKETQASFRCGTVVDRQSVGRTADHLSFNQQRVIGQDQQSASLVCASDWQLFALGEIHALHLWTQEQCALEYTLAHFVKKEEEQQQQL